MLQWIPRGQLLDHWNAHEVCGLGIERPRPGRACQASTSRAQDGLLRRTSSRSWTRSISATYLSGQAEELKQALHRTCLRDEPTEGQVVRSFGVRTTKVNRPHPL